MTTNRFLGGSAILPINKFRDDEFLNEDNKYNKIVMENTRKYILSQINGDEVKPINQMTDQQKYILTTFIQRFINELDSQVKKYYDNTDTSNAEDLIFKWNELVNYYNTNVDKAFKPLLDSRLGGDSDVIQKLQLLKDVALDANYTDKLEVIKLQDYIINTNYRTIQNIIFRKGEEQDLPLSRMEQIKEGTYKIRRERYPKVGRPREGIDVLERPKKETKREKVAREKAEAEAENLPIIEAPKETKKQKKARQQREELAQLEEEYEAERQGNPFEVLPIEEPKPQKKTIKLKQRKEKND